MGYRSFDAAPPRPRRTMVDMATPLKVYAYNGTTARLAIPCFYQEAHAPIRMRHHDRPAHDHRGWPDPKRPDGSCQLYEPFEAGWHEPPHTMMGGHPPVRRLLDGSRLVPIHLSSEYEGYTGALVAWAGKAPEGVVAEASIDPDQDWVVRVAFDVASPEAVDQCVSRRFSVFAIAADRRDLVSVGELEIIPAAIYEKK